MKIAKRVFHLRARSRYPTHLPKSRRTRYPKRNTIQASSAMRCSTHQFKSMAARAQMKRALIRKIMHKTKLLRFYLSAPRQEWRPLSEGEAMGQAST